MSGPSSTSASDPLEYGHYRVHRRADGLPWVLGAGGMGVMYKALDTRLHVDVALKIIHPSRLGDSAAQRLFVREARAAARIYHPNVAPVVFLHEAPGDVFYAMEFVDGVSLHAWMRRPARPSPRLVLALSEQIAAGLAAIHEQGFVHRDLKPTNLMVVEFPPGHPRYKSLAASAGCLLKIIDFGLAKGIHGSAISAADAGDPTRGFRGTVAYASPEQCEEMPDVDGRADLYSLGCIMWELVQGAPPFVSGNHREIMNRQVGAPPPWPEVAHLPEPLLTILRRLLEKDRIHRFANATALGDALQEARRELAVAATGHTPAPGPFPGGPEAGSTHVTPLHVGVPPPRVPGLPSTQRTPDTGKTPTQITFELPPRWWLGLLALLVFGAGLLVWAFLPRREAGPLRALPPAAATASLPPEAAARRRFIAVLPFANLASDKDSDFFAEGIHDEILTSLAKVRDFRLISRSSVLKYRGRDVNLREVARELGVGSVLEGSVRRVGNKVRVTTQLIDAETDQNLWAETFTKEVTDVFQIQSEVAKEIAQALATNLSPKEQRLIARQPTKNREAYQLFFKARSLRQNAATSRENLQLIVDLLERAIVLDPEFALAYAQLSLAHGLMYWYAIDQSPERAARARTTAETAARLQPELPEARLALGDILYRFGRDWEGALQEYRVALALAPNNAQAVEAAAFPLRRLNRWEEALQAFRQSVILAPEEPEKHVALAEHLCSMQRYAEAEPHFRRAVAVSDSNAWRHGLDLCVLERTGDWEEFVRSTRALLPRADPESAITYRILTGDFRGALDLVRSGPPVTSDVTVQMPRELRAAQIEGILGDTASARRDFAAAAEKLEQMVTARPDDAALRMKWALALAGTPNRPAAEREAAEALRQMPETRDAITARYLLLDYVLVCAQLVDPEKACTVLEHLLSVEIKLTRRHLRHFPEYHLLRGYPRFEQLLGK